MNEGGNGGHNVPGIEPEMVTAWWHYPILIIGTALLIMAGLYIYSKAFPRRFR